MIADIGTVFVAEVTRRLKSRPFLIGMAIGVLGILAFTRLPALLENTFTGSNTVVLVGDAALTRAAAPLLADDYKIAASIAPQAIDGALLKHYDAAAALAISESAKGLRVVVYAHDPGSFGRGMLSRALLPLQLQLTMHRSAAAVKAISSISVSVNTIGSKFTSTAQAEAARGIAYTLLIFLYILILINSQLVTTSVAEEKTSRIAELLVASVDTSALLAGKVLSGAVLSIIQLAVWIGASMLLSGGIGASAQTPAQPDANSIFGLNNILNVLTPGVLIAFLVYFIIGFLQLSTLLAGCASLINRTEDLGSITGPLIMPVIAALFIAMAALGEPEAQFSVIASMIPIISPFVMFARIAASNVPLWQIGLSLAINLAALYVIAVVAGKIYRVGMLLYGRPPKLSQIWHVLRA